MTRLTILLGAAVLLACAVSAGAAEPIRVMTTVPNLASIAREIGGESAEVSSIASGVQDAHFVDPKPSFIVKLRSADLLLVNGLDLEIGWVPPLTLGARNARIQPGGPGYIDCSARVGVLEIPSGPISRALGDVHPYGNPHYLTDPLNAEPVAAQIAAALAGADPGRAARFEQNLEGFLARLHAAVFGDELVELVGGAKLARLARAGELDAFLETTQAGGAPLARNLGGWLGRLRPHRGAPIVTYHRDYTYFAERFGLKVIDFVEPKPGIPPSARHIADLTDRLAGGGARLIITRPYVEHRSTEELARRTGVTVVTLPLEVGGDPAAGDYFALFDLVTARLASALGTPAVPHP